MKKKVYRKLIFLMENTKQKVYEARTIYDISLDVFTLILFTFPFFSLNKYSNPHSCSSGTYPDTPLVGWFNQCGW